MLALSLAHSLLCSVFSALIWFCLPYLDYGNILIQDHPAFHPAPFTIILAEQQPTVPKAGATIDCIIQTRMLLRVKAVSVK